MRRGLTELINGEADLAVCGATTNRSALEAIAATKPDRVITELSLDDQDPLRAVTEIDAAHNNLPVLLFTLHNAPRENELGQQAGACAAVSKRERSRTLLMEIRRIVDEAIKFRIRT